MFIKYVDFIDTYAEISDEERDILYEETRENKETAMLAQMFRNEGALEANTMLLSRLLTKKYSISPEAVGPRLKELSSEDLLELGERILECDSFENIQLWIRQKKQKHSDA